MKTFVCLICKKVPKLLSQRPPTESRIGINHKITKGKYIKEIQFSRSMSNKNLYLNISSEKFE
jgi:hypothetical protein